VVRRTFNLDGVELSVLCQHNPRARRIILRVKDPLTLHVTLPPRSSIADGERMVRQHADWLREHIPKVQRRAAQAAQPWRFGVSLLWRGKEEVLAEATLPHAPGPQCRIGQEYFHLRSLDSDFRPQLLRQFILAAELEFAPRVRELAATHGIRVAKVAVRDQRRRWGSCSTRGNISLNWRLLQVPPFVSDYVILHELAHRAHMDHSASFWREVERLCPGWREAEAWIRANARRVL